MRRVSVLALVLLAGGAAGEASAQALGVNEWRTGTTLSGFIGGATPSSNTSVAAGVALGWELLPHLTIEGSGAWIGAGRGADAFTASVGARVPLTAPSSVQPFASAGVGLYHAAFEPAAPDVPRFYRARMHANGSMQNAGGTFDDFMLSLGGGADVFLKQHLALRPDVRVLLVRRSSGTHAVAMFTLGLVFHFEDHPITPAHRAAIR